MTPELPDFHPLVTQWFEQLGRPTDIQTKAWPPIAAGHHCLISAPTGSGKTLTAFLWALNRFITGDLDSGHTRILYVSPLKALNNDIRNNLSRPLQELSRRFSAAGLAFPSIRVQTRSGDTEPGERRQMIRRPPEILITTPESLNLLLSSKSGLSLLGNLDTVIVDEVHAVIDNKRGAYLFSAVERLVALSGEFQRIALSATVKPLEEIAGYVAGYRLDTDAADYATRPRYQRRAISIVESTLEKRYRVAIRYPAAIAERPAEKQLWEALAEELLDRVRANRSTLIFVNNRALCEKLTHKINHAAGETLAYAHHGSLSRAIRQAVEQKLKAGELAAIVATASLEMGIDIGTLDEVLLIETAGSMAAAIQRIGRAGHQVGEVSRGVIYPTHAQDFLEAVVLARAVQDRDIEPTRPITCPLDVLAQVIISMTGTATWDIDQLYAHLRAGSVYHPLTREQFDLVITMLAGRYADHRIRELQAKVSIDRLDNTIQARKGALLSLYLSGGVIPNRGYFQLRHAEGSARIGELDEEFVWEAKIGQTFTLGTQYWRIEKITHNDVFVRPGKPGPTPPPFWKAESISRNFYFSERIASFLETANRELQDGTLRERLLEEFTLSPAAATAVTDYLLRQRRHTGCDLPHRHHLLIESVSSLLGYGEANQVVIHTGWGAAVNRPWAMAMEAAWRNQYGEQLEIYTSNESLVLQLPHAVAVESLLTLVTVDRLEQLLRQRLEGSGFFGARFRECAGRALLISKGRFNQRQPLWISRLRSQKLLDTVLKYPDFPILLETWRDCLQDEFDLEHLRQLLLELDSGEIRWSVTRAKTPSPMARNIAWEQVNQYMYMDDSAKADKVSNLRNDLLQDLIFNPTLRPRVGAELCADFQQRRQRLAAGYAPDTDIDLLDWVKERVAIPLPEWQQLLTRIAADHSDGITQTLLGAVEPKLARLQGASAASAVVVARERVPALLRGLYHRDNNYQVLALDRDTAIDTTTLPEVTSGPQDADELASVMMTNWLQFYGPLDAETIGAKLGLENGPLSVILSDLATAGVLVAGELVEDSETVHFCDSDNFEILLHLAKRAARPSFKPLPLQALPLFLARWQHLGGPIDAAATQIDATDSLFQVLQRQACYFAPAALWETELLPARLPDYDPNRLDHILREADLHWLGQPREHLGFCFDSDLDLLQDGDVPADTELERVFPDVLSRHELQHLQQKTDLPGSRLVPKLWQWVWAGRVANDGFAAVRKGIDARFRYPDAEQFAGRSKSAGGRRSLKRGAFSQWRQSSPFVGNWYRLDYPAADADLITVQERNKDRVRILLERYGIVFRELLLHEHPLFQWRAVFRSLRLMELSREVVSGYFFEGIPGPQFVSHAALRALQRQLPADAVYWINAKDPVSFCGSALRGLREQLPKRLDSNHLVYRGTELVLVSQRNGRQLTFKVAPDDPQLPQYLVALRHLLFRASRPLKHIQIDTINDEPARNSAYLDSLAIGFDLVRDYKAVTLYKKV
ncbi:DEAD/DEAH box helicase [Exilibacterium tricleocarpae]|uniref:DEAD/DEAH box helicase n=1 Tax=Exilibacterium tricleocarpae TaxID=2591008 RepID=A0A545SYX1_9GAMM|nr:DEAD/DEAH box helicase [Exilibacterium tricleocarpae]TQV70168.1 DEAD/DEAH box helicase [Exilibacterium tricleocarpae]